MYIHVFREITNYVNKCAKEALIQSLHICVWLVCGGLKGPIETIALQEFIIEQMRDFVNDFHMYAWYKVIAIFQFFIFVANLRCFGCFIFFVFFFILCPFNYCEFAEFLFAFCFFMLRICDVLVISMHFVCFFWCFFCFLCGNSCKSLTDLCKIFGKWVVISMD